MIWVTRDGRIMDTSEMDDSHLTNASNYVARRIKRDMKAFFAFRYEKLRRLFGGKKVKTFDASEGCLDEFLFDRESYH